MTTETTENFDHAQISFTARKVLEKRAREDCVPRVREMAAAAGVEWRAGLHRRIARRVVGGRYSEGAYLKRRFEAMSAALDEYPNAPVFEIAAGFSTRGLLENQRREAYVESDLAGMVGDKEAAIRKLDPEAIESGRYRFLTLDVTDPASMDAAHAAVEALALSGPLLVIHEGLMMYLDDDEQERLRDGIAKLLRICPEGGVWYTTDFSERPAEATFLQKVMSQRLNNQVGRDLRYFESDEQAKLFLAAGGLEGVRLGNEGAGAEHEVFRIAFAD